MSNVFPMRDNLRDDVKVALADPWALCERLGLTEGALRQARGLSIRCPAHNERTASCSVTVEGGTIRVKCFACDLSGDVFNLIAAVEQVSLAKDFRRVLERAAEIAGIRPDESPQPIVRSLPAPVVELLDATWAALPPLDEHGWDYLRDRDLDDAADLCRALSPTMPGKMGKWATDGYELAVALRNADGRVVGIQARKLATHDFLINGASSAGLFGAPDRVGVAKVIVVAEGLSDSLGATIAVGAREGWAVVGVAGAKATQALSTLPLAGKVVIVATDADGPGDTAAKEIEERLAKFAGATVVRARPVGGKDLCDMIKAGVDLAAFLVAAVPQSPIRSFADRIVEERAGRVGAWKEGLSFGVNFLNLALGEILPSDLILLGAATGLGKTELAILVAKTNAHHGHRVDYFALEADDNEIERRTKYKAIARICYQMAPKHSAERAQLEARLNYLDWSSGKIQDLTERYEPVVDEALAEGLRNLHTFYRKRDGSFMLRDFLRMVESRADETRLTILDHIHYVDSEDQNEMRGQKLMMKAIRELGLKIKRPTIVIGHLRKSDTKGSRLIPIIDDFHGSSDLGKMATKAILIGKAHDKPTGQPMLFNTYMNIAKCRQDGSRATYAGMVAFDARMGVYDEEFVLGRVSRNGDAFTIVEDEERPAWAQ